VRKRRRAPSVIAHAERNEAIAWCFNRSCGHCVPITAPGVARAREAPTREREALNARAQRSRAHGRAREPSTRIATRFNDAWNLHASSIASMTARTPSSTRTSRVSTARSIARWGCVDRPRGGAADARATPHRCARARAMVGDLFRRVVRSRCRTHPMLSSFLRQRERDGRPRGREVTMVVGSWPRLLGPLRRAHVRRLITNPRAPRR